MNMTGSLVRSLAGRFCSALPLLVACCCWGSSLRYAINVFAQGALYESSQQGAQKRYLWKKIAQQRTLTAICPETRRWGTDEIPLPMQLPMVPIPTLIPRSYQWDTITDTAANDTATATNDTDSHELLMRYHFRYSCQWYRYRYSYQWYRYLELVMGSATKVSFW